ncbi:hypothetical protein [Pseudonocardia abyssalis]|uniref:Integral membrane protein n=1 Tax=Pseudonocardia abyssalis TaxID=2792008 RepID=A0ABS6V057_9PSEU|nr:hypothetical protein [Pseudonocardia abyssalis]MBW0118169.1 hypothetical protein [Pseudonocardia abyssalis]MBW0137880.1 hypothetical protein [Pseudonocardia abyssalis]
MSTPSDPAQGQPDPGQQGRPAYGTGYGGVQYPYPEGQAPAPQPPVQPYPGPANQGQSYPYNPYGQASPYGQSPYGGYPAGLDDKASGPVTRPGIMVLALVLKVLAALPYLAFGVLFLVVPLDASLIPPELLDAPELAEAGLTTETLLSVVRVIGGFFAVLAVLYILFAVLAFAGRNWSRILVTVMTVGFALFLLFAAVSGGAADPASAAILLGPVALAVAGVVILFLPASNAYFSRR